MFCEQFICKVFGKNPVVECVCVMLFTEDLTKFTQFVSLYDDLRRFESLQKFVDIIDPALAYKKFSCGDVQEGNS